MNFIEQINTLTQSTELPLLTAFVLGILVALNPCQLAVNISAFSYLMRNGVGTNDGTISSIRIPLLYILGRCFTYTFLAWVMMCLIGGGANVAGVQRILSQSEPFLPYVLICVGIFMIARALHRHHHDDDCHNCRQIIRRNGSFGALMLGVTLAFVFCPESAVYYFGLMIPLSVTSSVGLFVPIVFCIAANIPNLFICILLMKAVDRIESVSKAFDRAQLVLNILMGGVFFIAGLLLIF